MKIIFLDHDGVICLSNNWGSRFKKMKKFYKKSSIIMNGNHPIEIRYDDFDKKAVNTLNNIIKNTDAEIVISSDWRLSSTIEEMGKYYENQGIIKRPIGFTSDLKSLDENMYSILFHVGDLERIRIIEIQKWTSDNLSNEDKWVAVDDLCMSPECNKGEGLSNFVLTPRSNEGIKQLNIQEKILNFLT